MTIEPITSGPFTSWSPEGWGDYAGDGNIVACGPGGRPLSTQRLENFRDGLEDFAYVKLVEAKYGRTVKVPEAIMRSMTDYTDDPADVRKWRSQMAEALVK